MAGTAEWICAEFAQKTCLVPRSDEFECQGQKSKVKATRDKNALCTHDIPVVRTEWNTLVADNFVQAADVAIQRGDFAILHALGLAGYRWSLPNISSFLISHCSIIRYLVCDQPLTFVPKRFSETAEERKVMGAAGCYWFTLKIEHRACFVDW